MNLDVSPEKFNFSSLRPSVLFLSAAGVFMGTALILKVKLIYLILALAILIIADRTKTKSLGYLSLIPFAFSVWKINTLAPADISLFVIGFVCTFIFLMQFFLSGRKETNPAVPIISGIVFIFFYYLFSMLSFRLFSSLLIVSPFGVLFVLLIVVFLRIQYFLWKRI